MSSNFSTRGFYRDENEGRARQTTPQHNRTAAILTPPRTEDGQANGGKVWLVKPPAFRSQQLTRLCNTLQARLQDDPKYRDSHTPRRAEGAFRTRSAPKKYPQDRARYHLAEYSNLPPTNRTGTQDAA